MRTARAPGRVNLIGEHTDHAGGLVLPLAIDREIRLRYVIRADRRMIVRSTTRPGEESSFRLDAVPPPAPGDWRSYVAGIAAVLGEGRDLRRGIEGVVEGDLPEESGLSSSAALEAAIALALCDANGIDLVRPRVAAVCRRAEREWAGVACGIMDQMAVLLGRADAALRIDCRTLEVRRVPLPDPPPDLVVIDTGVRRALSGSPYNERVAECREALAAAHPGALPDRLARRRRHFETENARVDAAVDALEAGDHDALGHLLDESHTSLRDDMEVSWPEADREVERTRASGALGARMLGGGFGGSVLALFAPGASEPFAGGRGARVLRPARGAEILGQSS